MSLEKFPVDEIDFISDQRIIATKNRLTKKLVRHLEQLRAFLADNVKRQPFPGIHFTSGKISKGENYQGFPYLVLDYPAIFKREDMFAVRTIIWWGNYTSNVFIIKGKYLDHFKNVFPEKLPGLPGGKLFFKGRSPWLNEVNKEYVPCGMLNSEDVRHQIDQYHFIKIVETHNLDEINHLQSKTGNFIDSIWRLLYE